jgi:hypothetical protein
MACIGVNEVQFGDLGVGREIKLAHLERNCMDRIEVAKYVMHIRFWFVETAALSDGI